MGSYDNYSRIRDSKGLNDSKVAQLSGVSKSTISEWKKGKIHPKVDKIERIAQVLGVQAEAISGKSFGAIDFYDTVGTFIRETNKNRVDRTNISFDLDDFKLFANIKADSSKSKVFAWLSTAPDEDVSLILSLIQRLSRKEGE